MLRGAYRTFCGSPNFFAASYKVWAFDGLRHLYGAVVAESDCAALNG
jgi:hypothetical protein